jgi:hypothetical protein
MDYVQNGLGVDPEAIADVWLCQPPVERSLQPVEQVAELAPRLSLRVPAHLYHGAPLVHGHARVQLQQHVQGVLELRRDVAQHQVIVKQAARGDATKW